MNEHWHLGALAVLTAGLVGPAWGASLCLPAPGLQGRIVSVRGGEAWVSDGHARVPAHADCLLRVGDVVTASGGAQVVLIATDGVTVTVTSSYDVTNRVPSGRIDLIMDVMSSLFGRSVLSEAATAARIRPGLSRVPGGKPPLPALRPPVPPGRQSVSLDDPLSLRWDGFGPFTLTLRDADGHETVTQTSELRADLSLAGLVPGPAELRLVGAVGPAKVPLTLVPASYVPPVPDMPDAPELVHDLWLLLRATPTWRLQAISRLTVLARSGDPLAGAILGDPF